MYFILMCGLLIGFTLYYKAIGKYKKSIIVLNVIATVVYVIWRVGVIPRDEWINTITGSLVLAAEIIGILQFLVFMLMFYKNKKQVVQDLSCYKEQPLPQVDVLICTYNESLELLKKTILASKDMRYPKDKFQVHVCDDGRREELRKLCEQYEISYITRADNEGAKAGNINHALKYLKGDLFVVLDADMLPTKEFLEETVGYFADSNVAFVQTPQAYYNQDMYQYNLKKYIPNEQDFFMRDVQQARAAHGAVLHVGTNAVFRRAYVERVGGYPTCSITEDMALGMLLQAKGYRTVFVNKVLAIGLSATTYSELISQRDRWCRGNLQVVKHFNPFTLKGLTIVQRVAYMDGVIYWCSSIQKMIFMLAPLLYLLFGVSALDTSFSQLLYIFIPYFLGQVMAFKVLSPNTRSLIWAHIYEVATAPFIAVSVLKEVLGIKIKFNVTPKNVTNDKCYYQFRVAICHILLLMASILAWTLGTALFLNEKISAGAYMINMAWSIYNAIAIALCCWLAFQRPILRGTQRVSLHHTIPTILQKGEGFIHGSIEDISEKGCRIIVSKGVPLKYGDMVTIELEEIKIRAKVVRADARSVGVAFETLELGALEKIMSIYMNHINAYYVITHTDY